MQLALFDFDHTLTTCDTYSRFLRQVATPTQLRHAKWSIGPWLLGYRAGLVSAASIRKRVTQLVFTDRDKDEIAEAALRYCGSLQDVLRPEAMQRLDWHLREGHEVALVSGSLDLYLQPWAERHGIALLCNRLEAIGKRLTGRYAHGDIGAAKAPVILARYDLSGYERIHAYGDSREDRPMLSLAHERWYRGKRIA